MQRFFYLILLCLTVAACKTDPLVVDYVDGPNAKATETGFEPIDLGTDEVLTGDRVLLDEHEDLSLQFSFRGSGTLWLDGRYPLALPEMTVGKLTPSLPEGPLGEGWHDVELIFKAAREDSPALLSAAYLDGNLAYYQMELPAPQGEAGKLEIKPGEGGIELSDIRFARTAGRESRLLSDGTVELNAPILRYERFEVGDKPREFTGWDAQPPAEAGFTNRFDVNVNRGNNESFGLRYVGELTIPATGEYWFEIFSPAGTKMYLNDRQIFDHPGAPVEWRTADSARLEAGTYALRIEYLQPGGWNKLDLAYRYEDQEPAFLNTMEEGKTISRPAAPTAMRLEADDEPYLLRSFLYFPAPKVYEESEKRTHVLSVGEGSGPHYSVDLQTGALLQTWRGGFADVHDMWAGRGEPQVMRPLGTVTYLDGAPAFATDYSPGDAWPAVPDAPDEDDFRLREYTLDGSGRPTFVYRTAKGTVTDQIVPEGDGLRRRVAFTGSGITWVSLAEGSRIDEVAPGEYELRGPGLSVAVSELPGRVTVLRQDGRVRLLVPVENGETLSYLIKA